MSLRILVILCCVAGYVRAETALDSATALFQSKRYPEARAAFEKILAAEPANAPACHYLGLILSRRGDATATQEAVGWLEKAVTLDPHNAAYLADFGGVSLQLAAKTNSVGAATRGRDAMEQAIALDPGNLDARQGLMQFYLRAPWPLGSSARAAAQLEAIRQHDPDLATVLSVGSKADAKDYAAAFKLCDAILGQKPDNYTALYQYGRTASLSGRNLDQGLAYLQKCLALPVPGPAAPHRTDVWNHMGVIQEKRGDIAAARAAYTAALQADPDNRPAATALAKLKSGN